MGWLKCTQSTFGPVPIAGFKILIIILYFHKQKTRKAQSDSNRYQRFFRLNYVTFLKTNKTKQ